MADTSQSDETQVFHRDQTKSALLIVVPLAVLLFAALVLDGLLNRAIYGVLGLGLLVHLVTLPRQNTLTVTAQSVSWRRRGRTCTIAFEDMTRVSTSAVVVNGNRWKSKSYVVLAFEIRGGAEILSQALFGEPGSGNAVMVHDAVKVISERLTDLRRAKGIGYGEQHSESVEANTDGKLFEPGIHTFATSQRYLAPFYVMLILGLIVVVPLVFSSGMSFDALIPLGLTTAVVYMLLKLPRSMKLVVGDESIEMIGIGTRRELRFTDFYQVRQVSEIQGFFEVTTLQLIHNDGRAELCGTLKGSMWPEKQGWEMVREATALINARLGSD